MLNYGSQVGRRVFRATVSAVNVALMVALNATAQDKIVRFSGEVKDRHVYTKDIGEGLRFKLDGGDGGWTIKIIPTKPADDECDNYADAGPPYHFVQSPLEIDASNVTPADGAARKSPRLFSFAFNCADLRVHIDSINQVLYLLRLPEEDVESRQKAEKDLERLQKAPIGEGSFWINDSRTTTGKDGDDYGRINWIKFRVVLSFPVTRQPTVSRVKTKK